jgi:hypothetical protein
VAFDKYPAQTPRLHRQPVILDAKMILDILMVTRARDIINFLALEASERHKDSKYSSLHFTPQRQQIQTIGLSFLPFAASCFGRLGPALAAIRFLAALAQL